MLTRRKFLATAAAVPLLPGLGWSAAKRNPSKLTSLDNTWDLDPLHVEFGQDVKFDGKHYTAGQSYVRIKSPRLRWKDASTWPKFCDLLGTDPVADRWAPKGKRFKTRGTSSVSRVDATYLYDLDWEMSGDSDVVAYWLRARLDTIRRHFHLSNELCQAIDQYFPWKIPNEVKANLDRGEKPRTA